MSILLPLVFFLGFGFHGASHGKELLSAEIVGLVFCDPCLYHDFSKSSHFISGASVLIECGSKSPSPGFLGEAMTDRRGWFTVQMPFSVGPNENRIKNCTAKLIRSSEPYCSVASVWSSSSIVRKSKSNGLVTFSAGSLTFKPLKPPISCKKPEPKNATNRIQPPRFPFSLPPFPFRFPPLPPLPFPHLPPFPAIPSTPSHKASPRSKKYTYIIHK